MDEGNESTAASGLSSNNEEFNNAGVIQIRLDTDPMLNRIELYLKGSESRYVDSSDGVIREEIVQVTKQKANTEGIYSLMSWLRTTINPSIVQGNIKDFDSLNFYLSEYRMNLAENIMVNLYNWEISEQDFEGIIDMIISMVHPFMSRLVNNKERESYSNTIQHTERSDTQREAKKSLPFF